MPEPDIRVAMFLPPDDTLRVWELRDELRPTMRWHEMMHADHASAFTVAKVARLDLLRTIRESLDRAMREGRTFEAWKTSLVPELKRAGWWGMVSDADVTGTTEPVIVNERRLQTIFRTNIRMSQAAGRWAKIQREKDRFPFLRYLSDHYRKKPRLDHRSWHGVILPVDHPWWQTHFPPNGWGCGCHYEQLTKAEMDSRGLSVSTPPDDGPPRPFFAAASDRPILVPPGIHPGFSYNPGTAHLRAVADKAATSIARAENEGLEAAARETLERIVADPAFDQFVALPEGEFPFAWINQARRGDIAAQSGMVRFSASAHAHIFDDRGRSELGSDRLREVAAIISQPRAVFRERGNHLVYFGAGANGDLYQVIVKTTGDRSRNYLSSVYRANRRSIERKRRSADSELLFEVAGDE